MAESQYSFGTSILTSTAPEHAATIIPHALKTSEDVIEKKMLKWFVEYSDEVQRTNQVLKKLHDSGSIIFDDKATAEYEGFQKVWNCLLHSVQTDIATNEAVLRALKLDSVKPLKDMFSQDVSLSELRVNSEELKEIAQGLHDASSGAEMQWNMKAPQIFDNFENFKKNETQLLFNVAYNYFNSANAKLQKSMANNENSVNYILSTYKIDAEMDRYLKYLVNKNGFSDVNPFPKQHRLSSVMHSRLTSHAPHHENASIASSSTNSKSPGKRASKLRSKVGSLFGRKHKLKKSKNPGSASAPINEVSSISSSAYDLQTGSSKSTPLDNVPPTSRHPDTGRKVMGASYDENSLSARQLPATVAKGASAEQEVAGLKRQVNAPASSNQFISGVDSPSKTMNSVHLPPLTPSQLQKETPAVPNVPESPNVVKYDSLSSPDDDSSSKEDRRASLLEKHDLDLPPQSNHNVEHKERDLNSVGDSNLNVGPYQQAASKYSFEVGDEDKHVVPNSDTTKTASAHPYGSDISGGLPPSSLVSGRNPIIHEQDSHRVAPPPPPSRKVIHNDISRSSSVSRGAPSQDMGALTDLNYHPGAFGLVSARSSFIQPQFNTLSAQHTGNSSTKHSEVFKHFDPKSYHEIAGLNSSIAEVMNVSFKDGNVVKSQAIGEIAFNYVPDEGEDPDPILLRLPTDFEKSVINNIFVHQFNETDYEILPEHIIHKTLGGLKYLRKLSKDDVPILVRQVWKFEDHQSSLMISLKLNPDYASKLVVHDLVVSVALSGCKTTGASSKPQGSFNKDKNRITWKFENDVTFSGNKEEQKLIARFSTIGKGAESDSGVQLKFSVSNPPKSVPLYDINNQLISSVSNVVTGSYSGHTVSLM